MIFRNVPTAAQEKQTEKGVYLMNKKTAEMMAVLLAAVFALAGCGSSGGGLSSSGPAIKNDNIEISQYDGVEIEKVAVEEVTDEDVEMEASYRMMDYTTEEEITDRPVAEGDTVNVDYVGTMDGVAFEGGTAAGVDVVASVDDVDYIPGFAASLIGHNTGDVFDADVTFPADYHEAKLAGKAAVFTFTINKISVSSTPELTDAFVAENIEGCDTVDDFKAQLREELETNYADTANAQLESEAWEAVIANTTVIELPEDEVQKEVDGYYATYHSYAESYEMEFSEFLETYMGTTEDDFANQVQDAAEESVKQRLIVEAIAEKEGIALSDEAFEEKIKELADEYGFASKEEFFEAYDGQVNEDQMKDYFLQEEVIHWIMDHAVQVEAKEEEAAEETDPDAETVPDAETPEALPDEEAPETEAED